MGRGLGVAAGVKRHDVQAGAVAGVRLAMDGGLDLALSFRHHVAQSAGPAIQAGRLRTLQDLVLGLELVAGAGRLDVQAGGAAGEGRDGNMHASAQAKHKSLNLYSLLFD